MMLAALLLRLVIVPEKRTMAESIDGGNADIPNVNAGYIAATDSADGDVGKQDTQGHNSTMASKPRSALPVWILEMNRWETDMGVVAPGRNLPEEAMAPPGTRLAPDSAEYAEYLKIALEATQTISWGEAVIDQGLETTVDVYEGHAIVAFKAPPRPPPPPPTIERLPDGSVIHRNIIRRGGVSYYLIFIDIKTKNKVRHGSL